MKAMNAKDGLTTARNARLWRGRIAGLRMDDSFLEPCDAWSRDYKRLHGKATVIPAFWKL
jgi:hypothetical protein